MNKSKKVILISVTWVLSLVCVAWLSGIGGYAFGTAESLVTSQVFVHSSTANARAISLSFQHIDENEHAEPFTILEDMLIRDIESYYSFKDQLAWYTPKLERFNLLKPLTSSEGDMRFVATYVRNSIDQEQILENETLLRLMSEYPDTR